MEPTAQPDYQPGLDQNQGIVGQMARAEQLATTDPTEAGVAQNEALSPSARLSATETGLNQANPDGDAEAAGVNDDLLTEMAVENRQIDVNGEQPDHDPV